MSGGSMDYTYSKIEEYAEGLCDKELTELAKDLAKVYRAAEWWHSSDSGENDYRKVAAEFKEKWLVEADRDNRLRGYIDESIEKAKTECYDLIGIKREDLK